MDIRTLIQATMIVWFLSACSLVFIWWTRKTYPGFGYWTVYTVGMILGNFLLSLHGSAPPFIPVLIGNGFTFASLLLALKGVRVFFGKGHMHPGYWIGLALFESALAWYLYVTPNMSFRVIFVSLFLGTIAIIIAWELFFNAPTELRTSSRFTGAVMTVSGVFFLLRVFATYLWIPLPSFFDPNIIHIGAFITSITVGLLGTLGFIMMNSQRLEHEIKTTGDKLQASLKELEKKISEVKTLSGLLPICASCKKIKDDKGYWSQIEAYIRDHSEAEFTHGICPECMKRLYPDFADEEK